MNNEYKHDRYVCPFCGSDNTDSNSYHDTDEYGYRFDNGNVYHYRYCCECGVSYEITYHATSVNRLA